MKVYKFGGASVKDVASVKNVAKVLKHEGFENTLVVVSAMGKMTNAFETIVNSYIDNSNNLETDIEFVRNFHFKIVEELFESKTHPIITELELLFGNLTHFFIQNKITDYNFIYDQIVGFGELLSTKIVSEYLNSCGIENTWIDVRDYIITDSNYREASVIWEQSKVLISKLNSDKLIITQGFLGADSNGKTTTLGREGSDYTAAIFANCLNAKGVTIWKDVEGVLNADPRFFKETKLIEQISYNEAIEMAFYGASVIHPKTLKPLENSNIPLFVRSFYNLKSKGTVVSKGVDLYPEIPCFILKNDQILVSIAALDFSFMVEHNLSDVFKIMADYKLKVNLIQNSALSFSVCIEDKFDNFSKFLKCLKKSYLVSYIKNVSLYTIRHITPDAINAIEKRGKVLLKQATKGTVQVVLQ